MQFRSPPPLPNLMIPNALLKHLAPIRHLAPIELIHRELRNACCAVLHRVSLLAAYDVSVNP